MPSAERAHSPGQRMKYRLERPVIVVQFEREVPAILEQFHARQ